MTFPSNASLEAIWDGQLGDSFTIQTRSLGTADSYGEKLPTFSAGTAATGRIKILKANEVNKEFGYLVPGDAIGLLKLTASIVLNDQIVFDSITYEVIGLVKKKTHQELALKRVT